MCKIGYRFGQVALTIAITFTLGGSAVAHIQEPGDLTFQADIYGSATPETIVYHSDLAFHGYGGFGTNSLVFHANLTGGDGIAYAVSASDPYAFTLNVTIGSGDPVTLTVTNSEYSAGTATMPSPSELHFVWEVEKSGLHLRLHRRATLVPDPRVTVQNVVREGFSIENLGPSFTLNAFSEYLHMDDRARVRDFDSDGRNETLLAINNFTTSWYPVFGKVYLHRPNITIELISDGRYATVSHLVHQLFASGVEQEIAEAAYVSSTARNATDAELQVASDAKLLLESEDRLTLQFPFNSAGDPLGLITSYFDHEYPTYSGFPNDRGDALGNITLYWGERRGAGTSRNCNRSPKSDNVCYDGHDGYDFGVGGDALAAADGSVSYVGCWDKSQNPPTGDNPCSDGLGLMVTISHEHGYETTYGHLATTVVISGAVVTRSQRIGEIGSTGNSTGTHLHFMVIHEASEVDPYGWIPGEVKVDPLTQPVTNTTTGEVYLGVPSYCLWETGCPTSLWVNPDDGAEIGSDDGAVTLA